MVGVILSLSCWAGLWCTHCAAETLTPMLTLCPLRPPVCRALGLYVRSKRLTFNHRNILPTGLQPPPCSHSHSHAHSHSPCQPRPHPPSRPHPLTHPAAPSPSCTASAVLCSCGRGDAPRTAVVPGGTGCIRAGVTGWEGGLKGVEGGGGRWSRSEGYRRKMAQAVSLTVRQALQTEVRR